METTALTAALQEAFPAAGVEPAPTVDLQETFYVAREQAPEVLRALRDRPELRFAFLAELTAADFWPREPRFELVYMLVSIEHRRRVRVKVRLTADCDTLASRATSCAVALDLMPHSSRHRASVRCLS